MTLRRSRRSRMSQVCPGTVPRVLRTDRARLGSALHAAASGDTFGDVAADVEVELDGQVGLAECLPGMAESF
jgi:hypothetical protein